MKKIIYVIAVTLALSVFLASPAFSQVSRGALVIDVVVKGNQAISTPTILSKIKTQPGKPFFAGSRQ